MAITQSEIARRCRVSQHTVSAILRRNLGHLYSEEIRNRVIKTAKELGYVPNTAAAAISKGRRGAVMMICPSMDSISTLDWGYVLGIQKVLLEKGEHLFFRTIDDFFVYGKKDFLKMINFSCDGIITSYLPEEYSRDKLSEALSKSPLPIVYFNDKLRSDSVYPDDFSGAKLITEYFIKKGHEKIAYLHYAGVPFSYFRNKEIHYSIKERYHGYLAAMHDAGLKPWIIHSEKEPHGLYSLGLKLDEIFSKKDFPYAFVCYCTHTPSIIMHKALQHSIREESIEIASFVSSLTGSEETVLGRRMITIQIPVMKVGELTAQILMEKIEKGNKSVPSVSVQYEKISET